MAPPGSTSSKKTSSSNSNPFGMAASQGSIPTPGISAASPETRREITRQQFFKGRPDVSDDRLERRQKQADELRKYKQDLVRQGKYVTDSQGKPVRTASGDYVYTGTATFDTDSSSPTFGRYVTYGVSDKAQELARKYGPTFREIGSDIGYATGSMAKGFGDLLSSGSFGILGAIKGIANYALDKANKGYDKLNDVQKYVFDNADRFTFASKVPQVEEVSKAEELALQADRDALGLELDQLIRERETQPTVDLRTAKDYINYQVSRPSYETTQPIDVKEKFQSAAEGYLDPKAREEALKKLEELNRMQTVEELQPKEKSELGILDLLNPFDEVPIQMGINEMINPEQVDIEKFKEEMNQSSLSTDDGTKVTAYNNPVNLQFAGQQGAVEGQTYGNNFAVFPDAETGIMAAKRDLALKTERYGGDVDKIIGEFSPRSDNLESFDNYVNFVKSGVGETVDPGEEDELLRRVIRFENKPDIANQYLTMVADGGMIDKQLKSLQNGLQNMYNGIPSVKRR
jgi:hypothetical protein